MKIFFNHYILFLRISGKSVKQEGDYMIQKKINEIETKIRSEYSNIAGIVIQKNGARVYEQYFNGYTAKNAVHVCSVTKSIFSALIGIAVDKKYITTVNQHVLDFFPDYTVKTGEKTIEKITIKNLLTMTAPYKYETEPYEKFFESRNPIYYALDLLGGDGPIGTFNYSAVGGTHILAGILVKATGQSVLDFAVENLFSQLGISVPYSVVLHSKEEYLAYMNDRNSRGWVSDPQGTWNNRQIVSGTWVGESTHEHSRCADPETAYGYLWWLTGRDSYAALGDGGNVIYINTKKKIVVAIASLLVPEPKDRIGLIKKYIEPAFED